MVQLNSSTQDTVFNEASFEADNERLLRSDIKAFKDEKFVIRSDASIHDDESVRFMVRFLHTDDWSLLMGV